MPHIRAVPHFNYNATNLKEEWTNWKQAFERYLITTVKDNEKHLPDSETRTLLTWLGPKGRNIYSAIGTDLHMKERSARTKPMTNVFYTTQEVIDLFTEFFTSKDNDLYERVKFNMISLQPGETLLEFITRLKIAASTCNYEETDDRIRSRLISVITDQDLLSQLMDKGEALTLEEATNMCSLHESRKMSSGDVASTSS